ncbi:TetR/AcrR family transcriptional regulator [Rhodococcoides kroppenstedtii]|uniref:TetR/AcrR family transcriptional regulator n=1 Tax=Rhodococcoides kroppenstedtii TaxID=293050 RepID=UPI0028E9FEFF|nr:TetR/AcrR family transcriptional regulator [Rhodococcus kroppenstedtii]
MSESQQRLLGAARDAFAEKGYYGTSTREIAARAGMSPAAMYIHFQSKQDMLTRLSIAGHTSALETLRDSLAFSEASATRRLRAAVYAFARWHAENHTTGRVLQHQLDALETENKAQVIRLRHETVSLLRDLVSEGVRTGEFSAPDVDSTTMVVMSLCIDIVRWYPSRELNDPDAVAATIASFAERMVVPNR